MPVKMLEIVLSKPTPTNSHQTIWSVLLYEILNLFFFFFVMLLCLDQYKKTSHDNFFTISINVFRSLTCIIKMGWLMVDKNSLIPIFRHDPNPTCEHELSPLIIVEYII